MHNSDGRVKKDPVYKRTANDV